MAKPIITTNVVGCKEVVEHGVNGFLCLAKSVEDLASKMENMLQLSTVERNLMGQKGRLKMELEFDEKIVIQKYLFTIKDILSLKPVCRTVHP